MIRIRNLKMYPGSQPEELKKMAAKTLLLQEADINDLVIRKRSIDARKNNDIHYLYTVDVTVSGKTTQEDEELLLQKANHPSAELAKLVSYELPKLDPACVAHAIKQSRPVVVGFGPAGIFAALVLAKAGLRPIVLERGEDALSRKAKVEDFWQTGTLDPESNVQFGEGGAGTFSDGKLNTGTKDPRIAFILATFANAGASDEICYDAKPHIGTDVLVDVVQSLRREIESLGGEVRFSQKLIKIETNPLNHYLSAVRVSSKEGEYDLPCSQMILAIGHSARDTFEMLKNQGIPMEQKPFSMGVRIEHRQMAMDQTQYGRESCHCASFGPRELATLPPSDYKLSAHLPDGSSAYTFCMCPGGYVVAAASEAGGVVTNGMSNADRAAENANAALLVTINPSDFPSDDVLSGMYWQREIEQAAFVAGGSNYNAPAQRVGDFLAGRPTKPSGRVKKSDTLAAMVPTPTYQPGVTWCNLNDVLPKKITQTIKQALPLFERKLRGFTNPDAILTAPETRSSSPVRILRGDDRASIGMAGLYPCGEGAGYAGGITSAAVDGMRCAEAMIEQITSTMK